MSCGRAEKCKLRFVQNNSIFKQFIVFSAFFKLPGWEISFIQQWCMSETRPSSHKKKIMLFWGGFMLWHPLFFESSSSFAYDRESSNRNENKSKLITKIGRKSVSRTHTLLPHAAIWTEQLQRAVCRDELEPQNFKCVLGASCTLCFCFLSHNRARYNNIEWKTHSKPINQQCDRVSMMRADDRFYETIFFLVFTLKSSATWIMRRPIEL